MSSLLREQLQASLGAAYTIEHELGGGGMSRVFVAEETALGLRVVVKVVPQEIASEVSVDRFRREIALAARLQHPHIVPLLTAGVSGDLPYFTMPYVEGESLSARLTREGELPVAEAVRIVREVASALAYAHQRGIVPHGHGVELDSVVVDAERTVALREPLYTGDDFSCDPMFDAVKQSPRFVALVRRTGASMCPPRRPWPIGPVR